MVHFCIKITNIFSCVHFVGNIHWRNNTLAL